MPIYEYRCATCGERFETLMARHGDPAPACTECGSGAVERVPAVFAVASPAPRPAAGPCGSTDCACRRAS